uniref:Uncharacterized protein n=1 Tax=Ditylenchus dipsaci TaxID=166011 RepID=A0A915EH69_9BILA
MIELQLEKNIDGPEEDFFEDALLTSQRKLRKELLKPEEGTVTAGSKKPKQEKVSTSTTTEAKPRDTSPTTIKLISENEEWVSFLFEEQIEHKEQVLAEKC